jgi:signal transduction histidine kinase
MSSAESSTLMYVGVSPLSELKNTLASISRALTLGTGIATLGGLVIGYWLSRRVMGPLRDISRTALEISHGNLGARVTAPIEPDLAIIASSFNSMADDLQLRLEAESRFAAQAAHELRSPLTAIKGAADLVYGRQDQMPEDLIPTLEVLNEKISYFERLLQDLLLLGRQASGVESANLTSRLPNELFLAIASHLSIPSSLLSLESDVDGREVVVDVKALTRVVDNLVRNANAYGGGLGSMSVSHTPTGVTVHIDDAGPGFSSLELESVLQPFQRGRLAHGTEGAGLGLSIAGGLLKSMGSTLVIQSSPTGGARCSFALTHSEGDQL